MKLTDDSPMPYGRYEGDAMIDVPASYLIWLYENNKCNVEVNEYIEDCIDALRKEIKENFN